MWSRSVIVVTEGHARLSIVVTLRNGAGYAPSPSFSCIRLWTAFCRLRREWASTFESGYGKCHAGPNDTLSRRKSYPHRAGDGLYGRPGHTMVDQGIARLGSYK